MGGQCGMWLSRMALGHFLGLVDLSGCRHSQLIASVQWNQQWDLVSQKPSPPQNGQQILQM